MQLNSFAYRAGGGSTGVRPGECLNNGFSALRAPEAATTFAIRAIALLAHVFCSSNKKAALTASSRATFLLTNYLDRVCTVFGVSLGHINLFLLCLTIFEEVGSNLREQSVA